MEMQPKRAFALKLKLKFYWLLYLAIKAMQQ
jgi:hypothetical protein